MLANAMRGLATEFGLTVSKGIRKLEELIGVTVVQNPADVRVRHALGGVASNDVDYRAPLTDMAALLD